MYQRVNCNMVFKTHSYAKIHLCLLQTKFYDFIKHPSHNLSIFWITSLQIIISFSQHSITSTTSSKSSISACRFTALLWLYIHFTLSRPKTYFQDFFYFPATLWHYSHKDILLLLVPCVMMISITGGQIRWEPAFLLFLEFPFFLSSLLYHLTQHPLN